MEEKYAEIEGTYGREGVKFVRKLLAVFAKARGKDHILWQTLKDMYDEGEIVLYREDVPMHVYRDKIILRKGDFVTSEAPYTVNACFGFVNEKSELVFAEVPFSLYHWEGGVNSLTTALLDLGRDFHGEVVGQEKISRANNPLLMINSLETANRLVDYVEG